MLWQCDTVSLNKVWNNRKTFPQTTRSLPLLRGWTVEWRPWNVDPTEETSQGHQDHRCLGHTSQATLGNIKLNLNSISQKKIKIILWMQFFLPFLPLGKRGSSQSQREESLLLEKLPNTKVWPPPKLVPKSVLVEAFRIASSCQVGVCVNNWHTNIFFYGIYFF